MYIMVSEKSEIISREDHFFPYYIHGIVINLHLSDFFFTKKVRESMMNVECLTSPIAFPQKIS